MKKLILSFAALLLFVICSAQGNPVDDIFNKYSEKEGFTVVTISGKMFNMFTPSDAEKSAEGKVISKLKSIRILSVEDSLLNVGINFYTELTKKLDISSYEELMVVKEGRNTTKFLVKQNGDRISQMLVITGGPDGNSLISIEGDLDMKSLSDISKDIGIEEMDEIDSPGDAPEKQ
jgi:hypothetical protein